MKKIIIFGGSGFIGSALANELCKDNVVTIFDNNERGHSHFDINRNVEWIKNDICSYKNVYQAIKHNDIVYNLAFINGTENFYKIPGRILEIAGLGQINVGRAINEIGIEQFIYASTSEVYQLPLEIPTSEDVPLVVPDPSNPRFSYGGGKIFGELLAIHHVKNVKLKKIFRPHNVYGPNMGNDHVIPQLVNKINRARETGEVFLQGNGTETRSFCHIDDAVKGICLIQEKGGDGIYHLGSGIETPIIQVANRLLYLMKVNAKILSGDLTEGSVKRRCPNIAKLKELGFSPDVDLQTGLSHFLENDRMVNFDE